MLCKISQCRQSWHEYSSAYALSIRCSGTVDSSLNDRGSFESASAFSACSRWCFHAFHSFRVALPSSTVSAPTVYQMRKDEVSENGDVRFTYNLEMKIAEKW